MARSFAFSCIITPPSCLFRFTPSNAGDDSARKLLLLLLPAIASFPWPITLAADAATPPAPSPRGTPTACSLENAATSFGLHLSSTESEEEEEGEQAAEKEKNSKRIQKRLSGSIYLWACGETEENEGDPLKLPDVLIGWLILMALAYIMLIVRAQDSMDDNGDDTDDDDNDDESGFSMASVTGAMYLLVASTTPDLRAGFTLLVDGLRVYQRAFGAALLTVYGLMICAAMKVLFSTSNDDASVVINAVTVLFIADVDEKALAFFTTVPYKWRLFWAIYTVGISFALALIGIIFVGDPGATADNAGDVLDEVPRWFVCAVNPGAVTLLSFYLSAAVLAFSEALSDACTRANKDETVKTWSMVSVMCVAGVYKALNNTKDHMRIDPCFCATLFMWFAHGVVSWWILLEESWGSPELLCGDDTDGDGNNEDDSSTDNDHSAAFGDTNVPVLFAALIISNVALVAGVSMKALATCLNNYRRPADIDMPVSQSQAVDLPSQRTCGFLDESCIPSLLVGWGIGFLATTLLLGGSLYEVWWSGAPITTEVISYLVIPCFFIAVVFAMADENFLGKRFMPYIDSTTRILQDKRGVWYWIVATAIRDILLIWVLMWNFLVPCLNNI